MRENILRPATIRDFAKFWIIYSKSYVYITQSECYIHINITYTYPIHILSQFHTITITLCHSL